MEGQAFAPISEIYDMLVFLELRQTQMYIFPFFFTAMVLECPDLPLASSAYCNGLPTFNCIEPPPPKLLTSPQGRVFIVCSVAREFH